MSHFHDYDITLKVLMCHIFMIMTPHLYDYDVTLVRIRHYTIKIAYEVTLVGLLRHAIMVL